mmetsp:Transcript_27679/g.79624  ORF Transcript_27679/g.79624 Transcript_27679/m.79624 type:complete len:221 (+) Transcript_27679:126-788(+)
MTHTAAPTCVCVCVHSLLHYDADQPQLIVGAVTVVWQYDLPHFPFPHRQPRLTQPPTPIRHTPFLPTLSVGFVLALESITPRTLVVLDSVVECGHPAGPLLHHLVIRAAGIQHEALMAVALTGAAVGRLRLQCGAMAEDVSEHDDFVVGGGRQRAHLALDLHSVAAVAISIDVTAVEQANNTVTHAHSGPLNVYVWHVMSDMSYDVPDGSNEARPESDSV